MKGGQLSDKVGELRATGVTKSGSERDRRTERVCVVESPDDAI